MTEFLDFWETKVAQLSHGYLDETGQHAQHCGLLAIEIAEILQKEGKQPSILKITGVKIDNFNTKELVPLVYEGSVSWGGHMVCVAEGLVYDPMLAGPEPLETYPHTAFGEHVLFTQRDSVINNNSI